MREKKSERWNPTECALLCVALVLCALVVCYNLFFISSQSSSSILLSTYSAAQTAADSQASAPSGVKGHIVSGSGTLNLNEASASELAALLPGVGETLAARIIEYREQKGGFTHVEKLLEVNGIGEATLESIRPYVSIS